MPPNQPGESLAKAWFAPKAVRAQEAEVKRRAQEVIEFIGLNHVRNELAGNLSGGQKKLLELGRTMMTDARVVLLDEIAAGVKVSGGPPFTETVPRPLATHSATDAANSSAC